MQSSLLYSGMCLSISVLTCQHPYLNINLRFYQHSAGKRLQSQQHYPDSTMAPVFQLIIKNIETTSSF